MTLNERILLDQTWAGSGLHELTAAVPAGSLVSGTNNVQVGAHVMPGNYTDDHILVNYWELDYRRLFRAWQGQFDFRAEAAGLHEYAVDGWTSDQVTIWDISAPDQPRRLTVTKGTGAQDLLAADLLKRCSSDSKWPAQTCGPSSAFSDR